MTTLRRRRIPLIALAGSLALAAPLMLSGCSLLPHLPGSGGGTGSHGITIPGVGSVGSGKVPSDFPSDVPLIKGDIVTGLSLGSGKDKAWNVTVKVSGVDAFDEIETELKGAGLTEPDGVGGKTSDGATGIFTSDKYSIEVLLSKADDKTGWVANYTVTLAQSSNG